MILNIYPKLNSFNNINNYQNPRKANTVPFKSNLKSLPKDTVSFSGKSKAANKAAKQVLSETINGLRADKVSDGLYYDLPNSIAQSMAESAKVPMAYFIDVMKSFFKKESSLYSKQDKIVQKFQFRIKEPDKLEDKLRAIASKMQKEAQKNGDDFFIRNKHDAIKLVDDIIGGRMILRDKSKKGAAKELDILAQIIKAGKLKVKQIEVYTPRIKSIDSIPYYVIRNWKKDFGWNFTEKQLKSFTNPEHFSYVDNKYIEDFARRMGLDTSIRDQFKYESRSNGYPAIHMLLEFPDGSTGELQIMDRDVELFKDLLEDGRYKVLCNKTKDMYKPLVKIWEKLKGKDNKVLAEEHQQYTFWTYITQRLKKSLNYDRKPSQKFLTGPESLRQEGLGYNQVAQTAREAKKWRKEQDAAQGSKLMKFQYEF